MKFVHTVSISALLAPLAVCHIDISNLGKLIPLGDPLPPPRYAKNNINNREGVAPDKGVLNGPVLAPLNASFSELLHKGKLQHIAGNASHSDLPEPGHHQHPARDDAADWLAELGIHGFMPGAPGGYEFFRNVKDYGAKGDGQTDDTAAINRAVTALSTSDTKGVRCGRDCGSTTVTQALVYFPPGTYVISTPIIQYYHTQFVGHYSKTPIIQGSGNFSGIALIDNDPYIPSGSGAEWYINQSNFLRQIRNMEFDLTKMPNEVTEGDQSYVPTGIHWQVGQATSISHCHFNMPTTSDTRAVGIFMENGSGGVMEYLSFVGGNIGFIAGSQQFTAILLSFENCKTAIRQLWNWGFTYKNLLVHNSKVAIDSSEYSDASKQGTGSLAIIDSLFLNTDIIVAVGPDASHRPSIVLDNVQSVSVKSAVAVPGGEVVFPASSKINQWVSGYQVTEQGGKGSRKAGIPAYGLTRPKSLVDSNGRYFFRDKPSYHSGEYVHDIMKTTGAKNDGSEDMTTLINNVLLISSINKWVIYFPAGIYRVEGTVIIPAGARIMGSSWSEIRGEGAYFHDENNPNVMVQVGKPGDSGVVEITDMLFTVKGPTAGCILMEWNIHESTQGSAGMWDSHFRIGGAEGSDLQFAECAAPASSVNDKCKAASLIMHVTSTGSGFFHNLWLWVADHDMDNPANAETYETEDGIPRNTKTQISIYSARGMLIESSGPCWFYGTASEHNQMYQYQLYRASNIFFGHMQTETPYYQPNPTAVGPFKAGNRFAADPTFAQCKDDEECASAWALRVIESDHIIIYGAGFYNFFKNNQLGCTETESCQKSMIETSYSERLWFYNLYTTGNEYIITPTGEKGAINALKNDKEVKNGYTSEVAAWLPYVATGGDDGDCDINEGGCDDDDDDLFSGPLAKPLCDWRRTFKSWDEVTAATDIPETCRARGALPLLSSDLDATEQAYNLTNIGYDELWGYYETYFGRVVNAAIANFTDEHLDYFSCRDDQYNNGTWSSCGAIYKSEANSNEWTIEWRLDKEDAFFSGLEEQFAVLKKWVKFGTYNQTLTNNCGTHPNDCGPVHKISLNHPMVKDNINAPNPKELISKAVGIFGVLRDRIKEAHAGIAVAQWNGMAPATLEVLSTQVAALQVVVDTMKDIKAKGLSEKIEEEKEMVLKVFSIIFLVVPVVGEVGEFAAPFLLFSRLAFWAGILGNAALDIYSIIDNPEMAIGALLGSVLGVGPVPPARTGRLVDDLSNARNLVVKSGKFDKTSPAIKNMADKVDRTIGSVCKL